MSTITVKRELPAQLLSDILVTAFDGQYGWSWNWFEPAAGPWLVVQHSSSCARTTVEWSTVPPKCTCEASDRLWSSVTCKLKSDCETGNPLFDKSHVVTHDILAAGIQRILDDNYVGIWRPATASEMEEWQRNGTPRGQRYRLVNSGNGLEIETGETARGYREEVAKFVVDPDEADIDAPFADAIVQVGIFGKCIFS